MECESFFDGRLIKYAKDRGTDRKQESDKGTTPTSSQVNTFITRWPSHKEKLSDTKPIKRIHLNISKDVDAVFICIFD